MSKKLTELMRIAVEVDHIEKLASSPSPSAVKLLKMLSTASGKTAMININLMTEVLALFGWSVTEKVGAFRLTDSDQLKGLLAAFVRDFKATPWGYSGVKDPKEFWFESSEAAAAGRAELERIVQRVGGTGPTSPEAGKLYVYHVEGPLNDNLTYAPNRWIVRTAMWWLGVPAWEFRTPKGDTLDVVLSVDYRGRLADPTAMSLTRFLTWGYKNGLDTAAKAFLENMGAAKVDEITRPQSARSLENTGTCPACFMNVKLTNDTIMRHGWQVQGQRGWGQYGSSWHSSACFGFRWPPFEVSKAGTEEYLKVAVQPSLERARNRQRELAAYPPSLQTYDRFNRKTLTVEKPADFVPRRGGYPSGSYGAIHDRLMHEVNSHVAGLEDLERTLEAKILAWTPQPLPGTR
jgi:hypothetical protein